LYLQVRINIFTKNSSTLVTLVTLVTLAHFS
jgi:hypothetical protein